MTANKDDAMQRVIEEYMDTEEYCSIEGAFETYKKASPKETEGIEIRIEKRALTLLKHIETTAADAAGRPPRPLGELISNMMGELHIRPTNHPLVAKVWNRLCDKHGVPEEKSTVTRLPDLFEFTYSIPSPDKTAGRKRDSRRSR
jgi:hypothetical protein